MALAALEMEDLPHYTYDDYAQWDGHWEVINGIPYAMVPSPTRKHQRLSLKIAAQLDALLANCNYENCTAYLPVDWQITEDTIVQPDVLVVCDENPDNTRLTVPPVLVFEILSPSTAHKDRGLKYRLYEEAGVTYYCIVDPDTKSAEVYQLRGTRYGAKEEFTDGKMAFEIGACTISFDFNSVFKEG